MFDKLEKSFYICLVPNGGGRPGEVDGRNRESGGGYESDSGAVPAAVIPSKGICQTKGHCRDDGKADRCGVSQKTCLCSGNIALREKAIWDISTGRNGLFASVYFQLFFEGLSRVNIAERDVVLRCGRWMDRLVRILISVVFPEVTDGGRVPLICPFLVKNRTEDGKSLEDMVS